MALIRNVFSSLSMSFLDKKNEKFLNVEKKEIMVKKGGFFLRQQRLHLLQLHIYQTKRVQKCLWYPAVLLLEKYLRLTPAFVSGNHYV